MSFEPIQYRNLLIGAAEVLGRPAKLQDRPETLQLHGYDAELVRDVFWDLFRQGFITLGLNDMNETWPFFRLSHFGEAALKTQSPYRFHDRNSFMSLVKEQVSDLSDEATAYLQEAVVAFYADCLLASCVMLGVAAEAEFLRLAEIAEKSANYGSTFAPVQSGRFIRQKITKFQECLNTVVRSLRREAVEDLEINFLPIQSVLRVARNEAGHPTAAKILREQMYINLQLFVPFARQLMRLRLALK